VKKLVLLTNDDGIMSPGIQALKNGASKIWDTIIVAPDREQSAASHALTLNRPLRINKLDSQTISVDGTPTDCVMLSLNGLLEKKPEFVISGLNYGGNLGDDVIYSGTVAAAAEASVLGVPAIAVSVVEPDKTDFGLCTDIACKVTEALIKYGLPRGVFLNVNIPPSQNGGIGIFEITNLGTRLYRDVIVKKTDPRGKPYYWIGGQVNDWSGNNDCDFAAVTRGNISVTPLQLNMTAAYMVDEIRSWTF
jgi:5'-nucleotidase